MFPIAVYPYQYQLNHVDHNRSKDEEKVDQNPEGQGCYAFSNLEDNCPTMMTDILTEPQGSYLWLRLKELSKTGTMSPKVPFAREQPEENNHIKNATNLCFFLVFWLFCLPEEISRMSPKKTQRKRG